MRRVFNLSSPSLLYGLILPPFSKFYCWDLSNFYIHVHNIVWLLLKVYRTHKRYRISMLCCYLIAISLVYCSSSYLRQIKGCVVGNPYKICSQQPLIEWDYSQLSNSEPKRNIVLLCCRGSKTLPQGNRFYIIFIIHLRYQTSWGWARQDSNSALVSTKCLKFKWLIL